MGLELEGVHCAIVGGRCFGRICLDRGKCCLKFEKDKDMAVQVREVEKEEKKSKREYMFYLPTFDREVQEMLIRRGHKIALKESLEWDIALLTGGSDIFPMLYGERATKETHCNIIRDLKEVQFLKTLHKQRMKVGICRGAQLLNVLSGGRLWQDVNHHHSKDGHLVSCDNWLAPPEHWVKMSSRHHQMMIPASDAWVIGSARRSTKKKNEFYGDIEFTPEQLLKTQPMDPEIVYYDSTHSLCFQPHPEDEKFPECTDFFFECIDEIWDDKKHEESRKEF